MPKPIEVQYLTIHGHQRAFIKQGSGPAVLLLHGLGCDHTTWMPVIADLARHYTVIAPDLLGHGASAKPRADYSVGGYANGMRDLLTVLGIDKVTVVGHSFGGGVAMQFAYQFPERTARLILVPPGDGDPAPPRAAAPHQGEPASAGHLRDREGTRLRRGRRDRRLVQGPPLAPGDPSRGLGRRRLARPDRHHGRPCLPHAGDAD